MRSKTVKGAWGDTIRIRKTYPCERPRRIHTACIEQSARHTIKLLVTPKNLRVICTAGLQIADELEQGK